MKLLFFLSQLEKKRALAQFEQDSKVNQKVVSFNLGERCCYSEIWERAKRKKIELERLGDA